MKYIFVKQIISVLLCFVILAGMLPTTVLAADGITQVELTLDVPVIGQTLDFEPTADAGNYEITSVRWLKDWGEHGNMLCDVYHKVEPGEPYTVRIWINPKEGYSFADLDDVTVTVNGSTDGVTFTHIDLYTGIICSVAFEKLGYNVSFDANGGTGTMEGVTNVYPDYTLPECGFTAPAGKVFNGWTVGSSDGKWYAAGSTMSVNADVTLYAKWADPSGSHKITFVNRTTNPYSTVEIIVSEGMYTLPGIEGIFQIPSGSTFDDWGISTGGIWQYFDPGAEISVTEDLEIIATWAYIEYEYVSKAVFEVKLNSGAEYKHGMLAGSLSVSLGEVTGTFNEGAPQPVSPASGGYGHGYWIVSGDMLLGTDMLSTRGGYRLYVKFDIPDDRNVRFHSDGFSLSGDLGNITAWSIVSLDGALVAVFKLPAVPGTPLTADAVTFTLEGYAIDQAVTALTVGSSTTNVSLRGSGYGIDNAYMIYEDYVDFDTKVTDPHAKFEKHQDYCLRIDYELEEGYSFPDSFRDGSYLKKDKFKLAGFEDAVVTAVTQTSVSFRLPQLGTTAVESLEITLNGYEPGKLTWDVSLVAPECMDLPHLDVPTYPPYGRLYCYYDPDYGFGDDADGDFMSISGGTVLKAGDQYPFAIKFYPVDGYDYSKLKKENITLVTPYGTCTATRFRPGFSENSYWLTFDLPMIDIPTVSFEANGGSGTMPDVEVYGVYTLPKCDFLPSQTRMFHGWNVGGTVYYPGDTVIIVEDTVITASWVRAPLNTYSVLFNAGGGSGTMGPIRNVTGDYTLPPCTFLPPEGIGRTVFVGWRVNDYTFTLIPGTTIRITENTVLSAVWMEDGPFVYRVVFNANGGSGVYGPANGVSGSYTLPSCVFYAPPGTRFKAWEVNGTQYAPGDKITVSADTTVTAVWENIYVVTFNANAGSGTMAPIGMTEGEYSLPECTFTAPAGMKFSGWNVEGRRYAPGDNFTVSNHIIVTAIWENASIGVTVSGSVTSYYSGTDPVTIQLIPKGTSEVAYETVVTGNSASYSIDNVPAGSYTVKVMKKNHATREYEITISGENVVQDAKIHLLGDLNGDGRLNSKDTSLIKGYVVNLKELDEYQKKCLDVNGDGRINSKDMSKIKAHVGNVKSLWS